MSYIIVDIEADGEYPEERTGYSIVCFGAIVVEPSLKKTFYGQIKPISSIWKPDALAISGFSREQHLKFDHPKEVMEKFDKWIKQVSVGHPIFVSDNLAFDWMWTNYYFHKYLGKNPFGYSGRRLGDMYCGLVKDSRAKWKHLRKTTHTHNPVDDAKGNAEVMLMFADMGMKIDYR